MDNPPPTPILPSPRRMRRIVLIVLVPLIMAAVAGGAWWRWHERAPVPAPADASDDPRLTYPTVFRNVRPEVEYVGDAACAGCHKDHSASYHRHPMGRSVAHVTGRRAAEHLDAAGRAAFGAAGLRYIAEHRSDRLFHREAVVGTGGEVLASVEAEIGFVIGSGTRGAGYLIAEDGYVTQSPISWYPQKGAWDLSPGYRQRNEHFDRPVTGDCLFCHANRVEPVENTINRYHMPLFRGEAIGCERCHGPGGLHVRRQRERPTAPGEEDDTIVNPRRLEPALREAVCEQCHLQGQARVLRHGRGLFDYRPGLPLYLFWSVFVPPPQVVADTKAVGQVEQMHQSRCFRASGGGLGCVSCHDPHRLPAAEETTNYYRARCLDCHGPGKAKDCSLPAAARRAKGDYCVACHMPRLSATDVVHVAATDHRILRDPAHEPAPTPRPARPGDVPLVFFHNDLPPDDAGRRRDLGVALMDLAAQAPPGPGRAYFGQVAQSLLEHATVAAPDDLAAWEALGQAWRCRDRLPEALDAYEAALVRAPERELALAEAATVAAQLGHVDDAIGYWRRAVAVNPRRPHYHGQLALLLLGRGQTAEALDECAAALRLSPASLEARHGEVMCLLKMGRKEQARAAFAKLLALKPPEEEKLRSWFATQVP
jgi:predicted CXXCH cytochrome family protein